MRRREFIAGLGSAAAWPVGARAQQPKLPVIGFLGSESPESSRRLTAGFLAGLAEAGYVDGRNVVIEYRWAEGRNERLPALATNLVRREVAVIAAIPTTSVLAATAATKSIPIVFVFGSDPIQLGVVASLNRPGGNATGVSLLSIDVAAKRLEMLRRVVPTRPLIGYLVNPSNPAFADLEGREVRAAAGTIGVQLLIVNAANKAEIEAALEMLVRERAAGLLISGDAYYRTHGPWLAALATRYGLPTMSQSDEDVRAGGLMSYGTDLVSAWAIAGRYTGRILNGEKPDELPVQQVTKIALIINLRTAKALGLTVPLDLLALADEVIE